MYDDDMSNTFVAEVGQKSAIFNRNKKTNKENVEVLEDDSINNLEETSTNDTNNENFNSSNELIDNNENSNIEKNIESVSQENNSIEINEDEKENSINNENDNQELFPEVKIDPPEEIPDVLKDSKENDLENTSTDEKNEKLTANSNLPNNNTSINSIDEKFILSDNNVIDDDIAIQKKKNPFGIILLIIICLAIGAGVSYYYFEIYNKNDTKSVMKKEVKETDNEEELQPDSKYVKRLVEQYTDFNNSLDLFLTVLANNNTKIKDLDYNYLQLLGAYNIRNYNSFTEEELQDSLDQLFGVDVIQATNKDIVISKCKKYLYKEESFSLEQSNDCNSVETYFPEYKIVKSIKNNKKEEIYINVAIALSDGKNLYKGYDKEEEKAINKVEDVNESNLDMDKDYIKFNQYKYTYKYDKNNNNYYLDSIDLEK